MEQCQIKCSIEKGTVALLTLKNGGRDIERFKILSTFSTLSLLLSDKTLMIQVSLEGVKELEGAEDAMTMTGLEEIREDVAIALTEEVATFEDEEAVGTEAGTAAAAVAVAAVFKEGASAARVIPSAKVMPQ